MSNETFSDVDADGDDITPVEYRRMLNRALREGDRRLQGGKLGDTARSRYMAQAVTFLEEERRRDEASRPDPEAAVIRAGHFLEDLIKVSEQGGLSRQRVQEILGQYVLMLEEHVETAHAFQRELTANVPA